MLQTQEAIKTGRYRYPRPNRSTKQCPAPGTKALQLHESFLLPINKPHKTQKSLTKSLKVMISKAINSQVLSKLALGTNHVGKRREKADSSCSDLGHVSKQPAAILANARCLRSFHQGQNRQENKLHLLEIRTKQLEVNWTSFWKNEQNFVLTILSALPYTFRDHYFTAKLLLEQAYKKQGGVSVSIIPTPRYLCT